MNFYIGQKVVCILTRNDGAPDCPHYLLPIVGHVYTVRGKVWWPDCGGLQIQHLGLYLEEIIRPPIKHVAGFGERTFWAGAFRPAVERKTDISIFQKMLTDDRVPA